MRLLTGTLIHFSYPKADFRLAYTEAQREILSVATSKQLVNGQVIRKHL